MEDTVLIKFFVAKAETGGLNEKKRNGKKYEWFKNIYHFNISFTCLK